MKYKIGDFSIFQAEKMLQTWNALDQVPTMVAHQASKYCC